MDFIGNYKNIEKEYEIQTASLVGLCIKISDTAYDIYGNIVNDCFGMYLTERMQTDAKKKFYLAEECLSYLYRIWIKELGLSRVGLPHHVQIGEDLSASFVESGKPVQKFEIGDICKEWMLRYAKNPCDENNPWTHYLRGEKIFK